MIGGYRAEGTAPGAWKDVEKFVADHGSFFAPLQAAFELSLGVLLVLGIGTGVVALLTAGHLTALWVSELAPRRWVWEILSVVVVAFVVGLSALPTLLDPRRRTSARLLGPPTFGPGVGMPVRARRRAARRARARRGDPGGEDRRRGALHATWPGRPV